MGVYTMAVSGAAAVAAGLAVPLADAAGRAGAEPSARGRFRPPSPRSPGCRGCVATPPARDPRSGRSLLRDPLAWQITVFFGLQSLSSTRS